MTTQALVAGDNTVLNTDTYVSWNGAALAIANLPAVNDGTGATVAKDAEIRFEATSDGDIEIRTADGRRVGFVPGHGRAVVVAEKGEVQEAGTKDFWRYQNVWSPFGAFFAVADATYSTNEVDLINEMRAALIGAGLMKAE